MINGKDKRILSFSYFEFKRPGKKVLRINLCAILSNTRGQAKTFICNVLIADFLWETTNKNFHLCMLYSLQKGVKKKNPTAHALENKF